ncbi:MAG: type II toxin-antitoxin system Phd/YefM family antitoxin [Treponema sp.]|nr:type II toxin-antitoxin system Phd/YefM family antitoxin [Treponema sp.]
MAALFDVKARFSEYVTMAENGEVVEITKHGKTSAVIIGIKEYSRLKENYRPFFVDEVNKWRQKTGGLSEEDYRDFDDKLARDGEVFSKESLF